MFFMATGAQDQLFFQAFHTHHHARPHQVLTGSENKHYSDHTKVSWTMEYQGTVLEYHEALMEYQLLFMEYRIVFIEYHDASCNTKRLWHTEGAMEYKEAIVEHQDLFMVYREAAMEHQRDFIEYQRAFYVIPCCLHAIPRSLIHKEAITEYK